MGDYGYPEKRSNKRDKKKKKRQGIYKKGGKYRSTKIKEGSKTGD